MNWPVAIAVVALTGSHILLLRRLRMVETAIDKMCVDALEGLPRPSIRRCTAANGGMSKIADKIEVRIDFDEGFDATLRGVIREEIEQDHALRATRSREEFKAYMAAITRDRPIIDAMRKGAFPTTPDKGATDE